MQHGGLAGGVAVRALLAEGADAQARDAGGDEHAAGVVERGLLLQQRGEDADRVEDGFDVEVHDFCERLIGVRVKGLAPGRAGVGKQDVDVVGVLAHCGEKAVDAVHGGRVGGHGDCRGVGGAAGQCVEDLACFLAGGGLAGGDEDLGAAGLHEAVFGGLAGDFWACYRRHGEAHADAACRPRPREPPVTTATLPLREKSEGKSSRVASTAADIVADGWLGRDVVLQV